MLIIRRIIDLQRKKRKVKRNTLINHIVHIIHIVQIVHAIHIAHIAHIAHIVHIVQGIEADLVINLAKQENSPEASLEVEAEANLVINPIKQENSPEASLEVEVDLEVNLKTKHTLLKTRRTLFVPVEVVVLVI